MEEEEPTSFGKCDAAVIQKELTELEVAKNTKKQTQSSVKWFSDFLCEYNSNGPGQFPPYFKIGVKIRKK